MLIPIHIIAGLIGLASGAVALYATKGSKLHLKGGMIFVYAMLVLSGSAALIAAILRPNTFNVISGMLAFYLVISGFLTVWRPLVGSGWINVGVMLMGLALGIAGIYFGFETLQSATVEQDGDPLALYFIFGSVALLAALGDIRMLLARRIQEKHRIARHLWRMCFALFMATGSFFLGQADKFPEPLRGSGLLAIPVLLVVLLMFYWLVRVLFTKWRPHVQPTIQTDVNTL